jgi:hypothetical protein
MIYKIVMVKIDHRSQEAGVVQNVFTKFGCNIKVRLGLHEVSTDKCAQDGLVILNLDGKPAEIKKMVDALNKIEYVKAQLLKI